ncbi:hypothetical protein ACFLUG_02175 [Chloroflexota bacterium]
MNFFKGLTVSLLGFLLFLCLSVFGLAFTLKSTVLSPDFITTEINRLNVSSFTREIFGTMSDEQMPEIDDIIFDTIENVEPVVKSHLSVTIYSIFDEFPGNADSIDLNHILREDFLNAELVSSVIDNVDIPAVTGMILDQQFLDQLPPEIQSEEFNALIDEAIRNAEPAIKEQLIAVAEPTFDYILGESDKLNASISIEAIYDSLKDDIYKFLIDSAPAEAALIPEELRKAYFDTIFDEFAGQIPLTIKLDETMIGSDIPAGIDQGLTEAEDAIEEAGIYVRYFETGYMILIGFMALLIIGIILILRDVRAITRRLGIPLITYGAIQYAGIWVVKILSRGQLQLPPEIPEDLVAWIFQFSENLLRPLEIFSLVLLITGVVLTVVSYVYKRGED